jgi:hypothetical protein
MHRQLKKQQESIAWHLRSSTTACLHFGAKCTLHNLSLIYIYILYYPNILIFTTIYKVAFHVNYYFLIKNESLPSEMANLPKGDNRLKVLMTDNFKFQFDDSLSYNLIEA